MPTILELLRSEESRITSELVKVRKAIQALGGGTATRKHVSEETRAKIRKALKLRWAEKKRVAKKA